MLGHVAETKLICFGLRLHVDPQVVDDEAWPLVLICDFAALGCSALQWPSEWRWKWPSIGLLFFLQLLQCSRQAAVGFENQSWMPNLLVAASTLVCATAGCVTAACACSTTAVCHGHTSRLCALAELRHGKWPRLMAQMTQTQWTQVLSDWAF
jgi:hypothetical protein